MLRLRLVLSAFHRFCLFSVLCIGFSATRADAVTFQIDFSNGGGTTIGTFNAPAGGGAVTNFAVTLSGITFDTTTGTTTNFNYDPTIVDFTYMTAFPSFTNSTNYAACAPGGCFLELYPDPTPTPGDYLAVDALLNNLGPGTKYAINPVPINAVPAGSSVLYLLTALLGIGALLLRRRSNRAIAIPA